MSPVIVGLVFDICALACLTVALAVGVPWGSVAPLFALIIGARASGEVRRFLASPGRGAPPTSGDSGHAQSETYVSGSKAADTISRIVISSGALALILAIPALLIHKFRS